MRAKLGVIMDPIEHIKTAKDSTFAMLLEAQRRGYEIYYLQASDLVLTDNKVMAQIAQIKVQDNSDNWFELGKPSYKDLSELDVILMRKDPPFNMEYIYTTYLLDQLQNNGTLVVNHPTSLRDSNEKLFATKFSQCIVPTIVTAENKFLNDFIDQQKEVVVKPLDGMAGDSIFRIQHNDPNRNVILETITKYGHRTIMAQQFIPAYKQGDKRILLIEGEPVPYALVRKPAAGELRANLAKGGTAKGAELTARDKWICEQIKIDLIDMQLIFVGIDVIGEYLTEINVTSPTGIRELDKMYSLNICETLFNNIEKQLNKLH